MRLLFICLTTVFLTNCHQRILEPFHTSSVAAPIEKNQQYPVQQVSHLMPFNPKPMANSFVYHKKNIKEGSAFVYKSKSSGTTVFPFHPKKEAFAFHPRNIRSQDAAVNQLEQSKKAKNMDIKPLSMQAKNKIPKL